VNPSETVKIQSGSDNSGVACRSFTAPCDIINQLQLQRIHVVVTDLQWQLQQIIVSGLSRKTTSDLFRA
jgi:hypothetical protein